MSSFNEAFEAELAEVYDESSEPSEPNDSSETETSHDLDGSVCRLCGVVHNIDVDDILSEELSDEDRRSISELIELLPPELRDHAIVVARNSFYLEKTIATSIARTLHKALGNRNKSLDSFGILYTLDQLTEGQASKNAEVLLYEQQIVSVQSILTPVKTLLNKMPEKLEITTHKAQETFNSTMSFVELMSELLQYFYNDLIDTYKFVCEESDIDVDAHLLETGVSSRISHDSSPYLYSLFTTPFFYG